jgi:hypothetical protein
MNADEKARFYAQRMHTPDDPPRAAKRAALRETSRLLIPLHRALIDVAKLDYALEHEPIERPAQFLQLLQQHPFFAWLKPMTSLIVDIDELARKDFGDDDAAAIADRVERLFGGDGDGDFSRRYLDILQRDIDVAAAHGSVRQAAAKIRG